MKFQVRGWVSLLCKLNGQQMSYAVEQFIGGIFYIRKSLLNRLHLVWPGQRHIIQFPLQLRHALEGRLFGRGRRLWPFGLGVYPGDGDLIWTELDFHTILAVPEPVSVPTLALLPIIGSLSENLRRFFTIPAG